MLKPMLTRLAVLCVIAFPLSAQMGAALPVGAFGEKQMDPAHMTAILANSRRAMKPASFVLSHRAELTLTTEQVRQLEILAGVEEDSSVVRQIRLTASTARLIKKREASSAAPQTGWVGTLDEKQVRDEACEQAGLGVEYMLNLMRDRKAVGTILTGTQIDRVQELEMGDMMRALKPKQP